MYRGKFRRETRDVHSVQLKPEALNTESKCLHHNQLSIINNLKQADLIKAKKPTGTLDLGLWTRPSVYFLLPMAKWLIQQ